MDVVVENLTKTYGLQKAVDEVSFEVRTGEILGFLGPNGAGKTTTMKMITSYLTADSGRILLGGKQVSETDYDLKSKIGYLPEHNPLYKEMTVMDYLAYAAALQRVPKSQIPERIRKMIKTCGLNVEKHKRINELSKGYRQRVGLAQAMIHNPEILILDEPTSGLDPNQIIEIRELIKELGKEKTVILSTHILSEVEETCDRILIIKRGQIVADAVIQVKIEGGEVDAIHSAAMQLPSVQTVDIIDRVNSRFEIQSMPEKVSNHDVFSMCVRNNWFITEMIPVETKLEDIFRDLTLN